MSKTTPSLQRPVIRPMPCEVAGITEPITSLNGSWKYIAGDADTLPYLKGDEPGWISKTVPYDVNADPTHTAKQYAFLTQFTIPPEVRDRRLFLRFEATQGLCAVYINGREAGRHAGGYMDWDCEITDYAAAGQTATLTVVFPGNDPMGTLSGGIPREVSLVARPQSHINRLQAECVFDNRYQDAVLTVMVGADLRTPQAGCRLTLTDPQGNAVPLEPGETMLTEGEPHQTLTIPVKKPKQWDAEHPNLYTLTAALADEGGQISETAAIRIGFRQIEIQGNILLVNGREVKLRGVCRHDHSPLTGHCVTREEIRQDVLLFKEANCNHIRTSHYPPTRYFLDLCDEYGIYVEDEIGHAFIGRTLKYSQKVPELAERYVRYFSEMIERDRSRASVLVWSIANESFYGPNFALCNEYAHRECPAIPTKFSYPMTMQEEDDPVDIWSIHYANYDTDLGAKLDNVGVGGQQGRDRPILHDEFAHIACYNRDEHRLDPAVRAFYGQSIETFWDRIWNTPGALGGAIWAGLDVASLTTSGRLLEWGIIDGWRRRKPEHFGVRRAYSPVKLIAFDFAPDGLSVTVENRFNHTDMSETAVTWTQGGASGTVSGFALPPRGIGSFAIPTTGAEPVQVRFTDPNGLCVEELELKAPAAYSPPDMSGAPEIIEKADTLTLRGDGFSLCFDKTSGLIRCGEVNGQTVVTGGPYLNMVGVALPPWELGALTAECLDNCALVTISGCYGVGVAVTFRLTVDQYGLWETRYRFDELSIPLPWEMKIRVGVHTGGLNELGVYYTLTGAVDGLSWERDGQNAVWPDDHIARARGTAQRGGLSDDPPFAVRPERPWSMDGRSYILYGRYDPGLRGSNDFRSSKHEVIRADALVDGLSRLMVLSDGSHSVRAELIPQASGLIPAGDERVRYHGTWHEVPDTRNRFGRELMSAEAGACLELDFTGTGIVWYAPVDTYYGKASVWLDGTPVDENVSLVVDGVEFPGASMGFDKRYQKPVFSATGLENGEHTLRVAVKDGYASADYFRILGSAPPDEVKFIVNNDYNYPKLAWGNRMRAAVRPKTGDSYAVLMKLGGQS